MCLAIPGKVLTIEEGSQPRMGSVSFAGVRRQVCLDWVPEVKVGDYVLVHVGFALSRVDEEEGVATTLNELAASARVGLRIYESSILVKDEVLGACEVLGLDPLYIANEGKLLAIVAAEDAENVLRVMREHPLGRDAAIIGEAVSDHPSTVVMKTSIGGTRVVDMLSGEQLPRIC